MSIRGIDVSDYQPNVNWPLVANSGMSFAFIKATEGATLVADSFARNWSALKSVGMMRGAYHFFRPATDVQRQVDNFLRTVKLEAGDFPPVLDIESTGNLASGEIIDRMTLWLDAVEKETGFRPIIYTYPGFWEKLGTKRFADYPLWIAHYTTAESPWVPGGWNSWLFWQYTDRGRVSGVSGNVDINIFESVREGMKGGKVLDLQKQLKRKGFDPGETEPVFATKTKNAVISLQKSARLEPDGIAGLKTWGVLIGKFPTELAPQPEEVIPTPTPTPTPEPIPPVISPPIEEPPVPPAIIQLVNVAQSYQSRGHQDQALNWLQFHLPQTVLTEFTQRWRNQRISPSNLVNLTDVCRFYRGLNYQQESLEWLQTQIPAATLVLFTQLWRNQAPAMDIPPAIRLIDVCQFYTALPTQNQALNWLQGQIPPVILVEFARIWRGQSASSGTLIRLTDVAKNYRQLPNQKNALEWLQNQVSPSVLADFAKQWRTPR